MRQQELDGEHCYMRQYGFPARLSRYSELYRGLQALELPAHDRKSALSGSDVVAMDRHRYVLLVELVEHLVELLDTDLPAERGTFLGVIPVHHPHPHLQPPATPNSGRE